MELDLTKADALLIDHRLRVAHADRFGSILSIGNASAAPRRGPIVGVNAVLAVSKAIWAAFRGAGAFARDRREGLASNEAELAACEAS